MKADKKGFSLMEFSVVILISGLTISALLYMLDLSYVHYNFVSKDRVMRSAMSNARVWLRTRVTEKPETNTGFPNISESELFQAMGLDGAYFINELKLTAQPGEGYFIRFSLCRDDNKNKKAETDECVSRLFFFRSRT